MYDLGSKIRAIRIQRGLTQKTLARRINKSISAVSSYEANTQMPPMDVLISIASVLGASLDYLAGFSKDSTIITNGLTEQQKEILDLLLAEFVNPSSNNKELSDEQIRILQKMIAIFQSSS